MLRAELSKDIPGIYVADSLDRYKVFFDVLERDSRGALHRRQRTRTFKIDDDYDIEGEPVDASTREESLGPSAARGRRCASPCGSRG